MGTVYKYLRALRHVTVTLLAVVMTIGAIRFPYDIDKPLTRQEVEAARKYYTDAYQKPAPENQAMSAYETLYMRVAEPAAKTVHIEEQLGAFVKRLNLSDQTVFGIGSDGGYLQDIAQNYTGLDIFPTVARLYHKKFILGPATSVPFPDNSFDAGLADLGVRAYA
jgi:Methyltransferase domain